MNPNFLSACDVKTLLLAPRSSTLYFRAFISFSVRNKLKDTRYVKWHGRTLNDESMEILRIG
jgi:hypothetical protein